MKKNINKLATLALTGMMVAGMSFGALAEEQTPVKSFNKVVATDPDNYTYAPVTTFSFSVAVADEEGTKTIGKYSGDNSETVYVYAGVRDGVNVGSAVFDGNETREDDGTYTKSVAFTVDSSKFTKPGVFHYTLTEEENTYDGIKCDTVAKDLYVVMVNNSDNIGYDCVGVFMVDADGNKIDQIVNDYGKTNDTTHDITISKEVTGNLGNKNEEFEFSVTVTGPTEEKYMVKKGNETSILTSGTAGTYELKDTESIVIEGLSESDVVKVTEKKANTEGYTTTVKYNNAELGEDQKVVEDNTLKGASVKVEEDHSTVVVTNSKEATTPTGVVMNVAPYAAMILGAGAFAGVFLGRKKSEDEE